MSTLFEELLQGWGRAFAELALLEKYRERAVVIKYAHEDCFRLEDYTPEHFPPGNELLDRIPDEIVLSYEEYGMGPDGLPCYCRTVFKDSNRQFAGFYRYSPTTVEYIQYNLTNRVPFIFHRMVFAGGHKVASLRAVANGGGHFFTGMAPEEAVARARSDEHAIFLYTNGYEYEKGRIVRDLSNNRAAGVEEYHYEGKYVYNGDGQLIEIMDVYSDGMERLRYCHWNESEGLEGLTARLAGEMAESIVNALLAKKVRGPLALLQLSYHFADCYLPVLVPLSVAEKDEIVKAGTATWEDFFLNTNGLYDVRLTGMEKTFAQFMQQVKNLEGENRARRMLTRTAFLLTKSRLLGRIPVDQEFFAYAIDGSIEGHDDEEFKDILLECGMGEELYATWKERGWMR